MENGIEKPVEKHRKTKPVNWRGFAGKLIDVCLIILIAVGVVYRLAWVNWSKDTNLHPDEYGLTNTLTGLSMPKSLPDYFNTRLSPISPYQKYDIDGQPGAYGPDNRMRWGQWPIILIRSMGELTGKTGYGDIRLLGRSMSATCDVLTLLILFFIGKRLFNTRIGLLAAALSGLAVMQIQQSHFMTVDNFSTLFSVSTIYAAVRIAQRPCITRPAAAPDSIPAAAQPYRIDRRTWGWFLLFGVSLGMTVASKINLAPLAGMILIAVLISIADLKLKTTRDLTRIALLSFALMAFAGAVSLVTFRVTQPMSFRAAKGDTSFFTVAINADWWDSMKVASSESSGFGGGPPAEQWAQRPILVFPVVNMVFWGMGLPLGIMVWAGWFWALWLLIRGKADWRAHLLPLVWVGGYFAWMATRWVSSVRYFLPIYPLLCLYAAWGLVELWKWRAHANGAHTIGAHAMRPYGFFSGARRSVSAALRYAIPLVISLVVVGGALAWATAFVNAVYRTDPTRVRATEWVFHNIPAPFHLTIQTSSPGGQAGGLYQQPLPAVDELQILPNTPYSQLFTADATGRLVRVTIPHAALLYGDSSSEQLRVTIASDADPQGAAPLDEAVVDIPGAGQPGAGQAITGLFHQAVVEKGKSYFLLVSPLQGHPIAITRNVVAVESWDEGLPVPYGGYDPFGQFYRGVTLEVRWGDGVEKKAMFEDILKQTDYIIMSSQRAVWASCRLPQNYPMTMAYYRALFNGGLGFDLAATFTAPMKVGPLNVSDVAGTFAWNQTPQMPVFNHNILAAEEAFSVYDHPPVWIFKKRADFNIAAVENVLNSIDLSKVIVQSPKNATGAPCR